MIVLNAAVTISPWVSLVISVLGLSASLLVAYVNNFKKSRPGVLTGSRITIYPVPYQTPTEVLWGGTAFVIPMTFFNWSPNGGSVIECRLNISALDKPGEVFDIAWTEFVELSHTERRLTTTGFAQPLPLPPKSSLTKTILFVWTPFNGTPFTVAANRYKLDLLVWTTEGTKASVKQSFGFTIDANAAMHYQASLENKTPFTIDAALRETNRNNATLSQIQATEMYG